MGRRCSRAKTKRNLQDPAAHSSKHFTAPDARESRSEVARELKLDWTGKRCLKQCNQQVLKKHHGLSVSEQDCHHLSTKSTKYPLICRVKKMSGHFDSGNFWEM